MKRDRHGLIVGGTGQDGTLLAQHLLDEGWSVTSTGRQVDCVIPDAWHRLGIVGLVDARRLDPLDADAVEAIIKTSRPDGVFCLAAQSSVGRSFEEPRSTFLSNELSVLNVLESVRTHLPAARVLVAGSGEVFGETTVDVPATEMSAFAVRSPYGAAKAAACIVARSYRDVYGIHVSVAHLFGHESPLRGPDFVFGRLLNAIEQIRAGSLETITLGSLSVVRDWGWAPDYVVGMRRMVELDRPAELVLATGQSVSLEFAARSLFAAAGLEFDRHVRIDGSRARARDIAMMHADPAAARDLIGWEGSIPFPGLADRLVAGLLP
jgi:GDPmannose 4,6-dehydratase